MSISAQSSNAKSLPATALPRDRNARTLARVSAVIVIFGMTVFPFTLVVARSPDRAARSDRRSPSFFHASAAASVAWSEDRATTELAMRVGYIALFVSAIGVVVTDSFLGACAANDPVVLRMRFDPEPDNLAVSLFSRQRWMPDPYLSYCIPCRCASQRDEPARQICSLHRRCSAPWQAELSFYRPHGSQRSV